MLQQTNPPVNSSFQTAFTDTITALRTAAGFTTIFTATNVKQDADSPDIVVSVRLPYLLPSLAIVAPVLSIQNLSPDAYQFVSLSSYPTLETPPPRLT